MFGSNIRALRIRSGQSQGAVARSIGISQNQLSAIERGEWKNIRIDLVMAFASYYLVPAPSLADPSEVKDWRGEWPLANHAERKQIPIHIGVLENPIVSQHFKKVEVNGVSLLLEFNFNHSTMSKEIISVNALEKTNIQKILSGDALAILNGLI